MKKRARHNNAKSKKLRSQQPCCDGAPEVPTNFNGASTSQQGTTTHNSSSENSDLEVEDTTPAIRTSSFSESTSDSSSSNDEQGDYQAFLSNVATGEQSDSDWSISIVTQSSSDSMNPQAGFRRSDSSSPDIQFLNVVGRNFNTKGTSWEGPLMYLPMLARLRVRQSEKNLRPLEKLCLQCVSDNLDYFSKQDNPFASLPGSVLQMLTRFLEQEDTLINHKVLPLVINPRTEYLPLNLQKPPRFRGDSSTVFWTQDFVNIFKKMQLCKMRLKFLEFNLSLTDFLGVSTVQYPTLQDLHLSLADMKNLQELKLDIGAATDETLAVISANCVNLKKLDLDGNNNVSDDGIKVLCGVKSCCIEITSLSLRCTNISKHGVVCALKHLPQLKQLWIDDYKMMTKALDMYKENPSFLKLELETFTPNIDYEMNRTMAFFCSLFKYATELDLSKFPMFNMFSELPNITSVIYSDETPFMSNYFYYDVILHYNSQLTKLDIALYHQAEVDFSLVGHACINLESFTYQLDKEGQGFQPVTPVTRQAPKFSLDENLHFTKLKDLDIQYCGAHHFRSQREGFQVMLSSASLESVSFTECNIPSVEFASIIDGAKVNEKVFSNLKKLYFSNCEFSFNCLKNLICLAPNLKNISMYRCNDPIDIWINMKESIGWFITQNRLNIEFVFVPRGRL